MDHLTAWTLMTSFFTTPPALLTEFSGTLILRFDVLSSVLATSSHSYCELLQCDKYLANVIFARLSWDMLSYSFNISPDSGALTLNVIFSTRQSSQKRYSSNVGTYDVTWICILWVRFWWACACVGAIWKFTSPTCAYPISVGPLLTVVLFWFLHTSKYISLYFIQVGSGSVTYRISRRFYAIEMTFLDGRARRFYAFWKKGLKWNVWISNLWTKFNISLFNKFRI